MPWKMIPGALKKLRREKGFHRRAVVKWTGFPTATVRRHEDAIAEHGLQDETVRRYAKVYECEPEAFARWINHGEGK